MITEPGIDKVIADNLSVEIKKRIDISLSRQENKRIYIVAHIDCLVNPASEERHKEYLQESIKNIRNFYQDASISALLVWETGKVIRIS